MCVVDTRQPGSATVDVFCIGRLIATHAPHLEEIPTWTINMTHAIENPPL